MEDKLTPTEAEQKQKDLLRLSDHLSDFGTLTSLASTAAYFIEGRMPKKLPKPVTNFTVGAIFTGMGAVICSYAVRFQAGRMAEKNKEPSSSR